MTFRRVLGLILLLAACAPERSSGDATAAFAEGTRAGRIDTPELNEASGLVASAQHVGLLWTHNDSGDEPRIFAIDTLGALVATVRVTGVRHRDWEDIARRGDTLFVADIGDNAATRTDHVVHAVLEPSTVRDTTVQPVASYLVRYPDGARDAEAFLVDPRTGDWFIVTKREARVRLYRAAAASRENSVITLELISDSLSLGRVTAGDVSADGGEVLVKSYTEVFHWRRAGDESLAETLQRVPQRLPYVKEPAGESIAFAVDGVAYFTLSERVQGRRQALFRYRRWAPNNEGAGK